VGRLKHRLRPMRGLRTDRTTQTVITGHAFIQNLRRGHYELAVDEHPRQRVAAAFTELAKAI
jgi:IS6 family transposase